MPEWFNGAVLKTVEGFVLRGFKSYRLRHHWGVVKWLRHRSLTPTFRGSNPLTPAKNVNTNLVLLTILKYGSRNKQITGLVRINATRCLKLTCVNSC